MAAPVAEIHYLGTIHSPFSGLAAEDPGAEEPINRTDGTLLFVYYGNGGGYGYASARLKGSVGKDIEGIDIEALPERIGIYGALVMKVDTGWNGATYYGFAPEER